MYKTVMRKIM